MSEVCALRCPISSTAGFRLVLAGLCDDHSMSGGVRAAVLVAAVVAYSRVVRPRLRTWGASRAEVGGALPGDDLVADRYRTTHAVTIASPPADVWPPRRPAPRLSRLRVRGGAYSVTLQQRK